MEPIQFLVGMFTNLTTSAVVEKVAVDVAKQEHNVHPFKRTSVKVGSLVSTTVFSATDLPNCFHGALALESFTSSASQFNTLSEPNSFTVVMLSMCSGALLGYGVDSIIKETFKSFAQQDPGMLVNVGAGILAWKMTSSSASFLSREIRQVLIKRTSLK